MKGLADGSSNPSNKNGTATKGETKFFCNNNQRAMNKGAWTTEEDHILAETVAIQGPKRWKKIAASAEGLKRCGKSCRLRWMNYLRPNIKRGNISDQEEDLILRLHKLLGNRWSLIAGRLPGRTDNEIKNYWNSHLSKRVKKAATEQECSNVHNEQHVSTTTGIAEVNHQLTFLKHKNNNDNNNFITKDQFDYLSEGLFDVDWISGFLEIDGCV